MQCSDTKLCLYTVHYAGMVHCDIKMANVLIAERDGQHRGILTDFDLSKDDKSRKAEASSFAARSMASFVGPRGTFGALTMAPEVMEGNTPDAASDCWSFGGLVMASLYKVEGQRWGTARVDYKWGQDGAPILLSVHDDQGKRLLSSLLHKVKEERMSSQQAVSHAFFNANMQVLKTLEDLEQQRQGLQGQLEEHERHVEEQRKLQQKMSAKYKLDWEHLQTEKEAISRRHEKDSMKLRLQEEHLQKAEINQAQKLQEIQERQAALEKENAEKRRKLEQEEVDFHKKKEDAQKMWQHKVTLLKKEGENLKEKAETLEMQKNEVALREAKVRMPRWYTHTEGFHLVDTKHVRGVLHQFMVDSAHTTCSGMKGGSEIVSMQRIENKDLWCQYQAKKQFIESVLKERSFQSLSDKTTQPLMPNRSELTGGINEFYL
jgi:serine/threonine protein kinase